MGNFSDPSSSDTNSSSGSRKRRRLRLYRRKMSWPCGHCCENVTDRKYYSSARHYLRKERKKSRERWRRKQFRRDMQSPKSSSSSEKSEREYFSSRKRRKQLDLEKPYKAFFSRVREAISSEENCNNDNEITRASVESSEHGLNSAMQKQYAYEHAETNDFLNLSLKFEGTRKLRVEGISPDDFKLNTYTETSAISTSSITTKTLSTATEFHDFRCNDGSSYKTETARAEHMYGLKARRKRIISKNTSQTTHTSHSKIGTVSDLLGASQPQRWDEGIFCDLCNKGPSLLLGEWFCAGCGLRIASCVCFASEDHDNSNVKGRVHKMCALWSSDTHVDVKGSIQGLSTAIMRGKRSKCTRCQQNGATVVCSVETCGQSFHYPCADLLASRLRCLLWIEEERFRLKCYQHQFEGQLSQANELSAMKNRLKRAVIDSQPRQGQQSPRRIIYTLQPDLTKSGSSNAKPSDVLIEVSSYSEKEDDKKNIDERQIDGKYKSSNQMGNSHHMGFAEQRNLGSRYRKTLYFIGVNLLSEDISNGCEPVPIPCTNDIDSAPAPFFKYNANAEELYRELFLSNENLSDACKGCSYSDVDNPHKDPSPHVNLKGLLRHSDARFDWQGQPMFGRLPYDQYGRLQVGHEGDIIECNSRCPCGAECLNKELQKGLRFHLELYRAENQFWAVRTTEAITRGKFVVEYVGEISTHENAHKRRGDFDLAQLGCFSGSNHQLFMTDGYRRSNVARFIRSSLQGNLEIHRVYTETVDPRFYRIGLYATRNIEIGEELSFQNSFDPSRELMCVCFPSALRKSDELTSAAMEM